MNEVILQFAAYSGFAKAETLNRVAAEEWARVEGQNA
jgi:alkylhydroperoxidase/carboxymuconolactone decarboxylase family protein YurZ